MPAGELIRRGSGSGGDGSSEFDWNRIIKTNRLTPGTNVGGETIQEGLENALFGYIAAVLSLNTIPLREVGENYAPILVGALTPNDETIITARRVSNVTDNLIIAEPGGNAINVVASAVDIVEGLNKQYRIEADVDNNGNPTTIMSPTRDLEGVHPFLIGISSTAGLSGNALYTALQKLIQKQGNKTQNIDGSGRVYCAYPAIYPDLKSILDPSSFESIGDFTKSTISVTSSGLATNWTVNYKKYELNNITNVPNLPWQFKF